MKHQTSELDGALLDAAVAKAEGHDFKVTDNTRVEGQHTMYWQTEDGSKRCVVYGTFDNATGLVTASHAGVWFMPSADWAIGGPIIERERIAIESADVYRIMRGRSPLTSAAWLAACPGGDDIAQEEGPTPLIAAMRAFVASKFGAEVEL